jgi:hypothetical protein
MTDNLNEYDEIVFKNYFENSELYHQLAKDFDILLWDKFLDGIMSYTPRQQRGDRMFTLSPFYYINKLTETNPNKIYDLGCGWNIFKRYIPNVIGVDARKEYVDIQTTINEEYVATHQEYFESVFSICSLHFYSLSNLEKNIKDFVSMVKKNGRGFLSLNLERMIERTTIEENISLFATENPSDIQYDQYIRDIVGKISCKYLIVDIDIHKCRDDFMNGNIRLVFEKR